MSHSSGLWREVRLVSDSKPPLFSLSLSPALFSLSFTRTLENPFVPTALHGTAKVFARIVTLPFPVHISLVIA